MKSDCLPVVIVEDDGRSGRIDTGFGSICNSLTEVCNKPAASMCVTKKDLFICFNNIKDIFSDNLAHDKTMKIGLCGVNDFVNSFFLADVDHDM